jgi:glycosyltransferase involved in cell wall biosynthesis
MLATTVDCEIIVSDNASTDHTEEVMRAYTDPRIRYYRQATNIGSIPNHNFLLSQARGEYLNLFGDDDRALPGCFERKAALLDADPHLDIVFSRCQPIDPQGNRLPIRRVMGTSDFSYMGGRVDFNDMLLNCMISWQSLMLRREVAEAAGPLGRWGLLASDDWYWLQLCMRHRQVAFINEASVEVRTHPGSFSIATAIKEGYFMKDRMMIWRKWLLEADDPPVVTELMWERMVRVITLDVQEVYGPIQARLDEALLELSKLNWAYSKRMEARFETHEGTLLHFRPGLAPWPLEGRKGTVFLHVPNWAGPAFDEVLTAYGRAFTAADDVTLALWLDPTQGVSLEEAAERIMGLLQAADLDPEATPDLLLVPDALGQADQARLYTAADWLVPLSDPLQIDRARRLGKPYLEALTPEAWRVALAQRAAPASP